MKLIRLHGALREFELLYAPDGFRMDVNTPVEAARLLAAQIPAFDKAIREGSYRVRIGPLGKGGKTIDAAHILQRLGPRYSEIHIVPAGAGGAKGGMKKVVLGVAILGIAISGGLAAAPAGAAFGTAMAGEAALGMSFGQIALTGASMVLTGAASLLANDAQVARYENREAPEDRPNFVFSQITNTLNEGGAVQWVFGKRVRVGSTVLSAGIFDEQIGPGLPEPASDGMIAGFSSTARGLIGDSS